MRGAYLRHLSLAHVRPFVGHMRAYIPHQREMVGGEAGWETLLQGNRHAGLRYVRRDGNCRLPCFLCSSQG